MLRNQSALLNWGLRDYGTPGQLGLEKTPEEYVAAMVAVFREVRRVLKGDGVLWLNLGDSYIGGGRAGKDGKSYPSGLDGTRINSGCVHAPPTGKVEGLKTKDLVGIPWRVAFALQADGWYLRSDIIWAKPNPMPESVTDRPTKAHEYIFLMSKSAKYYYTARAVYEPFADERMRGWGIREAGGNTRKRHTAGRTHNRGYKKGYGKREHSREVEIVALCGRSPQ